MRHRLKTKRRKRRRRTRNRRRKRKRNPKRPSEKKGMRRICWIKKKKKNPFIRTSADDDDGGKCRLKRKKTQNSCSAVHFYFDSLLTFFLFFFKHNSSGQIFFYFAAYSDFYLQIFSRFFFLFKGKWGGETFEHFSGTTKATRVAIFKRSHSPKMTIIYFCFFFCPEMIGSRWKENLLMSQDHYNAGNYFFRKRNAGRSDLFTAGGQFVFDREPHLCHFISWLFRWVLPHKWALLLNVCRSPENSRQLAPFNFWWHFSSKFVEETFVTKTFVRNETEGAKWIFSPFFKKKIVSCRRITSFHCSKGQSRQLVLSVG